MFVLKFFQKTNGDDFGGVTNAGILTTNSTKSQLMSNKTYRTYHCQTNNKEQSTSDEELFKSIEENHAKYFNESSKKVSFEFNNYLISLLKEKEKLNINSLGNFQISELNTLLDYIFKKILKRKCQLALAGNSLFRSNYNFKNLKPIILNTIALECASKGNILLYRCARKNEAEKIKDFSLTSLSYGTSLFAGALYDGTSNGANVLAYHIHHIQEKEESHQDTFALNITYNEINNSPFFIPQNDYASPLHQVAAKGEGFHIRQKLPSDGLIKLKEKNIGAGTITV